MKPHAPQLEGLLKGAFGEKHVRSALRHFSDMGRNFQTADWEHSIGKAGKFVEAVTKALWQHVGETLPRQREFKVGTVLDRLENLPKSSWDDSIRIAIPRACRFIYEIASNRGGRHDSGDIDPNQMDAVVVNTCCSWMLAELVRYSSKGAIDLVQAQVLITSITQREFPSIENIDGRIYFHLRHKTARSVAILTLWYAFPKRLSREELMANIVRNGFSRPNAAMAVTRIASTVDDHDGTLRLLSPGVQEADRLVASDARVPGAA